MSAQETTAALQETTAELRDLKGELKWLQLAHQTRAGAGAEAVSAGADRPSEVERAQVVKAAGVSETPNRCENNRNPSTPDLHQPLLFAPSELLACGLRDAHHHPLVGVRTEAGVRSWRTSPATAWEHPRFDQTPQVVADSFDQTPQVRTSSKQVPTYQVQASPSLLEIIHRPGKKPRDSLRSPGASTAAPSSASLRPFG